MKKYQSLWQQLTSKENVILVPHIHPDGDALGATFGLQGLLQSWSAKVKVRVIGEHIQGTEWMGSFDVIPEDHWSKYDVVFLDTATKELVFSPLALTSPSRLLMDHHPKTSPFYEDAFIDTTATSTCEIIAAMALEHTIAINAHTATCLLFGILHDTTVLTHPYVSTKTFSVVQYLIDHGASYHDTQRKILKQPLPTLQAIFGWMSRLQITPQKMGYLYLTYQELSKLSFPFNELFRQCRQIADIKVVCVVVEKDNEYILHFQSDSLDLHSLLASVNGAGHAFASKVRVATKKESYRVIETVDQLLTNEVKTLR